MEASVRCFNSSLIFENREEFVGWFRFKWENSDLFNGVSSNPFTLLNLAEIEEKYAGFPDKMFYLQNCAKTDINGKNLIYCFIKDDGVFRKDGNVYRGYRCFTSYVNGVARYSVNNKWEYTSHNANDRKWLLLTTNIKKYHDEIIIKNK